MAVSSVASSTSSNTPTIRSQAQPEQAQQTRKAADEQVKAETQSKPVEAPKPVVNTQGQTTGKIINITA